MAEHGQIHLVRVHPAAAQRLPRRGDAEVDGRDIPEIIAFNKSDLVSEDELLVLRGLEPDAVFVSARTGAGIDELIARISELLPRPEIEYELLVPFDRGDVVALAHDRGRVLSLDYEESGTRVRVLVDPAVADPLRDFVTATA